MNSTQEILQEELSKNHLVDSLLSVRNISNTYLEVEYALTCMVMIQEIHPLLNSINEKYPHFEFSIEEREDSSWKYLASNVEVLDEEEVSDFVIEISEYLDKFVSENFSDLQIRNYFPTSDLVVEFNGDYSKELLEQKILKELVNEETYRLVSMMNLQKNLPQKESTEKTKSKL